MSRRVIVVATHPDDETLGCGGTLLRHKAEGDLVTWLVVTGPGRAQGFGNRDIERRRTTLQQVAKAYDFDDVIDLNLPAAGLDTLSQAEIVGSISQVFSDLQPEVAYLPFCHDVHTDHQTAFKAAFACTKTFRHPYVKRILMMETLSETDFAPATGGHGFTPNVFVDITGYLERKLEIMRLYHSEIGPPPFPRSIENLKALATLRGSSSGFRYAESFMLLKELL